MSRKRKKNRWFGKPLDRLKFHKEFWRHEFVVAIEFGDSFPGDHRKEFCKATGKNDDGSGTLLCNNPISDMDWHFTITRSVPRIEARHAAVRAFDRLKTYCEKIKLKPVHLRLTYDCDPECVGGVLLREYKCVEFKKVRFK